MLRSRRVRDLAAVLLAVLAALLGPLQLLVLAALRERPTGTGRRRSPGSSAGPRSARRTSLRLDVAEGRVGRRPLKLAITAGVTIGLLLSGGGRGRWSRRWSAPPPAGPAANGRSTGGGRSTPCFPGDAGLVRPGTGSARSWPASPATGGGTPAAGPALISIAVARRCVPVVMNIGGRFGARPRARSSGLSTAGLQLRHDLGRHDGRHCCWLTSSATTAARTRRTWWPGAGAGPSCGPGAAATRWCAVPVLVSRRGGGLRLRPASWPSCRPALGLLAASFGAGWWPRRAALGDRRVRAAGDEQPVRDEHRRRQRQGPAGDRGAARHAGR